ncbi:MAG: AEC family transporter [Gammaproteobacteria bacterium]|jgi:predicted permease|nr:AEC family transporter [Gammaproteobacteria bacterium]NBD95391.1 AEC family transporter [Gammaproteobacteria bacterium]
MSAYFVIISLIVVGRSLAGAFPPSAPEVLNRVVIMLCLPALIFIHVPTLEASTALLPLVVVPWTLLAVSVGLVLLLARWLEIRREAVAVLLLLLPLGNTSFLGFPLVEALLGEDRVRFAVVYDQFGSFLIVCTHALFVLAWFGTGTRPSAADMGKRIVTFPPFIALVGALLLGNDWFPDWLMSLARNFADMLLPLVTLAIGMSLRLRLVPEYRRPLLIGLASKLVILPAVALGLILALDTRPDIARVALMEASMPPMITAAALLSSARLAPPLASALVAWGVLLSALTVPLWFFAGRAVFGAA